MFWVDVQVLGDDQLGDGGRYFQLAEARAGYNPTQITEYIPSTSAASSTLWPVGNLHDGAAWSVWSTAVRASASGGDWVAFWWPQGVQTINSVRLLPRNVNGKALGFPTSFTLHWADHSGGSAVWRSIVTSTARPDGVGWLTIALPHSVRTEGIVMMANTLGTDDYGSYVFQLAEARASYNPALAQSSPYEQFDVNHILSTGQSLSVGARGEPVAPDVLSRSWYGNLMFAGGVTRPKDLSAFAFLHEDRVETMSTALVDHVSWRRRTELPLIRTDRPSHQLLVSGNGIGSRSYSQLQKLPPGVSCPSGTHPSDPDEERYSCAYPNSLQQVQAAHDIAASLGQTHAVRAVTVVHGESDHADMNTNYADNLATWQRNYEQDIKLITGQRGTIPLLQSQMSSWTEYYEQTESLIPQAQIEAHRVNRGKVILVGPKYNLEYAPDGVHLTAGGYRHMGEYYAKVYRRVVLEGGVWEPIRPRAITRAGAVITVRFYVPVPPLVFDTSAVSNPQNYGFQVVEGGSNVSVPITRVQVSGPDTVTITLARAPTGANPRVRYAFTGIRGNPAGPTTGARGNLRDSDTTPSRYGKKLYNWSVHFEHPIPFSDR